MQVRYLGHASFQVTNSAGATLVTDPWLSTGGAFLRSWFQFPENHFLADEIAELLTPGRDIIYFSHHHRDHFDRNFLSRIDREIELLIPRFVRRHFAEELKSLGFRNVKELRFGESIEHGDFRLTVFVDDCYTNEDSGLLIEADDTRFLNMNDCRAYDRIDETSLQPLDLFTIQFSGASWFPSVYDYTAEERDEHAKVKNARKFANVRALIERLNPKMYVPSAGPASFLDLPLQQHNFGNPSPFPDAGVFHNFVNDLPQRWQYIFPGDKVALKQGADPAFTKGSPFDESLYEESRKREYIADYASRFRDKATFTLNEGDPWDEFRSRIEEKVATLKEPLAASRVAVFSVAEAGSMPARHLRVDLRTLSCTVGESPDPDSEFYQLVFEPAVLNAFFASGFLWEDLMLSLRFLIRRNPDVFDSTITDFARLETIDMRRYPWKHHSGERMRRVVDGVEYEFDRYCPHNDGDLLNAPVKDGQVICPRHGWCFSLKDNGACTDNPTSVNARRTGSDHES